MKCFVFNIQTQNKSYLTSEKSLFLRTIRNEDWQREVRDGFGQPSLNFLKTFKVLKTKTINL